MSNDLAFVLKRNLVLLEFLLHRLAVPLFCPERYILFLEGLKTGEIVDTMCIYSPSSPFVEYGSLNDWRPYLWFCLRPCCFASIFLSHIRCSFLILVLGRFFLRPHPHRTRREKWSKLGRKNPTKATALFTLRTASNASNAWRNKHQNGAWLHFFASRVALLPVWMGPHEGLKFEETTSACCPSLALAPVASNPKKKLQTSCPSEGQNTFSSSFTLHDQISSTLHIFPALNGFKVYVWRGNLWEL